MKVPSPKLYLAAILLWSLIMGSGIVLVLTSVTYQERGLRNIEQRRRMTAAVSSQPAPLMSRAEALSISAATPEVRALEALFAADDTCIQRDVLRPCDTDWVTCVDDAWVVVYDVAAACLRRDDDRMALRFLVDSRSGAIRSRYPEIDYFRDPEFCQTSEDCLPGGAPEECLNFVSALTQPGPAGGTSAGSCVCERQRCSAQPNRF